MSNYPWAGSEKKWGQKGYFWRKKQGQIGGETSKIRGIYLVRYFVKSWFLLKNIRFKILRANKGQCGQKILLSGNQGWYRQGKKNGMNFIKKLYEFYQKIGQKYKTIGFFYTLLRSFCTSSGHLTICISSALRTCTKKSYKIWLAYIQTKK